MELQPTPHKPSDARMMSVGASDLGLGDEDRAKLQLEFLKYRFRRSGRFRGIFWSLISRLAVDIGLWVAFIVAIKFTEKVGKLDKGEKYLFNAVGVGLPLMIGLNINSSFKGMATAVRWKILASGPFTLQEVCCDAYFSIGWVGDGIDLRQTDLILSLDSFLVVARLGYLWLREALKSDYRWGNNSPSKGVYIARALICFGWIILMLVC